MAAPSPARRSRRGRVSEPGNAANTARDLVQPLARRHPHLQELEALGLDTDSASGEDRNSRIRKWRKLLQQASGSSLAGQRPRDEERLLRMERWRKLLREEAARKHVSPSYRRVRLSGGRGEGALELRSPAEPKGTANKPEGLHVRPVNTTDVQPVGTTKVLEIAYPTWRRIHLPRRKAGGFRRKFLEEKVSAKVNGPSNANDKPAASSTEPEELHPHPTDGPNALEGVHRSYRRAQLGDKLRRRLLQAQGAAKLDNLAEAIEALDTVYAANTTNNPEALDTQPADTPKAPNVGQYAYRRLRLVGRQRSRLPRELPKKQESAELGNPTDTNGEPEARSAGTTSEPEGLHTNATNTTHEPEALDTQPVDTTKASNILHQTYRRVRLVERQKSKLLRELPKKQGSAELDNNPAETSVESEVVAAHRADTASKPEGLHANAANTTNEPEALDTQPTDTTKAPNVVHQAYRRLRLPGMQEGRLRQKVPEEQSSAKRDSPADTRAKPEAVATHSIDTTKEQERLHARPTNTNEPENLRAHSANTTRKPEALDIHPVQELGSPAGKKVRLSRSQRRKLRQWESAQLNNPANTSNEPEAVTTHLANTANELHTHPANTTNEPGALDAHPAYTIDEPKALETQLVHRTYRVTEEQELDHSADQEVQLTKRQRRRLRRRSAKLDNPTNTSVEPEAVDNPPNTTEALDVSYTPYWRVQLPGAQTRKPRHPHQRQEPNFTEIPPGFADLPKLDTPEMSELNRSIRRDIKELARAKGLKNHLIDDMHSVPTVKIAVKYGLEQDPERKRKLLLILHERNRSARRKRRDERKSKIGSSPMKRKLADSGAPVTAPMMSLKRELKRELKHKGDPGRIDRIKKTLRIAERERRSKDRVAEAIKIARQNKPQALSAVTHLESTWQKDATRQAHGFKLGPPTIYWDTRSMGCSMNDMIHTQLPPGHSTVGMARGGFTWGLLHLLRRHAHDFKELCGVAPADVCEFIARHILEQPIRYSCGRMFFYDMLNPTEKVKYLVVVLTPTDSFVLTAYPADDKRLRAWKKHIEGLVTGVMSSKSSRSVRRLLHPREVPTGPPPGRRLRSGKTRAVGQLIKPRRVLDTALWRDNVEPFGGTRRANAKLRNRSFKRYPFTIRRVDIPALPDPRERPLEGADGRDQARIWRPSPTLVITRKSGRWVNDRRWRALYRGRVKKTIETVMALGAITPTPTKPDEGPGISPNEVDGVSAESFLSLHRNPVPTVGKMYTANPVLEIQQTPGILPSGTVSSFTGGKAQPQPKKADSIRPLGKMKIMKASMVAGDFEALLAPLGSAPTAPAPAPTPAPPPPPTPPTAATGRDLWELNLRMMHNVNMLPKAPRAGIGGVDSKSRKMYTTGPFPMRDAVVVPLISRIASYKLAVLPLPFRGCPRVFRLGLK